MNELVTLVPTILFLFVALIYTVSIIVNAFYKRSISSMHMVLFSAGWTGFITLMWLL